MKRAVWRKNGIGKPTEIKEKNRPSGTWPVLFCAASQTQLRALQFQHKIQSTIAVHAPTGDQFLFRFRGLNAEKGRSASITASAAALRKP